MSQDDKDDVKAKLESYLQYAQVRAILLFSVEYRK